MKRINIYTIDNLEKKYCGWFDEEKAVEIACSTKGNVYITGKILLVTAKGKLIINEWDNTGMDEYRFARDKKEIAEILEEYDGKESYLLNILSKYEV